MKRPWIFAKLRLSALEKVSSGLAIRQPPNNAKEGYCHPSLPSFLSLSICIVLYESYRSRLWPAKESAQRGRHGPAINQFRVQPTFNGLWILTIAGPSSSRDLRRISQGRGANRQGPRHICRYPLTISISSFLTLHIFVTRGRILSSFVQAFICLLAAPASH